MDVREGAGEMLWMYTPFHYVVKKIKGENPYSLPSQTNLYITYQFVLNHIYNDKFKFFVTYKALIIFSAGKFSE